jgi:hypothetical protein
MLAFMFFALFNPELVERKLLFSISLIFGLIAYHNLSKLNSFKNEQ